jgi:hypothetical protein
VILHRSRGRSPGGGIEAAIGARAAPTGYRHLPCIPDIPAENFENFSKMK